MQVKLSDRLKMSAQLVGSADTVADVGCDHAHTSIWLIQNGFAKKCIGMDLRKGPLGKALDNLRMYGCVDDVELRLSYGLDELHPGEAQVVVIAGMGGEMIKNILEKDLSTNGVVSSPDAPALVLQPQSHYASVRKWLCEHDYTIVKEDMCAEDDKFYPAMRAEKVGRSTDSAGKNCAESCSSDVNIQLSDAEIFYGPCLLKEGHPVLKEYLEIEYRKKQYLLGQLDKSDSERSEGKRAEVKAEFDVLCEARKICADNSR